MTKTIKGVPTPVLRRSTVIQTAANAWPSALMSLKQTVNMDRRDAAIIHLLKGRCSTQEEAQSNRTAKRYSTTILSEPLLSPTADPLFQTKMVSLLALTIALRMKDKDQSSLSLGSHCRMGWSAIQSKEWCRCILMRKIESSRKRVSGCWTPPALLSCFPIKRTLLIRKGTPPANSPSRTEAWGILCQLVPIDLTSQLLKKKKEREDNCRLLRYLWALKRNTKGKPELRTSSATICWEMIMSKILKGEGRYSRRTTQKINSTIVKEMRVSALIWTVWGRINGQVHLQVQGIQRRPLTLPRSNS